MYRTTKSVLDWFSNKYPCLHPGLALVWPGGKREVVLWEVGAEHILVEDELVAEMVLNGVPLEWFEGCEDYAM